MRKPKLLYANTVQGNYLLLIYTNNSIDYKQMFESFTRWQYKKRVTNTTQSMVYVIEKHKN